MHRAIARMTRSARPPAGFIRTTQSWCESRTSEATGVSRIPSNRTHLVKCNIPFDILRLLLTFWVVPGCVGHGGEVGEVQGVVRRLAVTINHRQWDLELPNRLAQCSPLPSAYRTFNIIPKASVDNRRFSKRNPKRTGFQLARSTPF